MDYIASQRTGKEYKIRKEIVDELHYEEDVKKFIAEARQVMQQE